MRRINYILNGVLAMVAIVLFAQCAGKKSETAAVANVSGGIAGSTNMKIAYVEIDTLLTKYNFWNDLNEMMMKKEENIRATLNQKGRELQAEAADFQRKIDNNAFVSRERAEQENARLVKKQQDLQELQTRLTNELAAENQKNSLQLRDSINSFLKIYNKDKGYSLIISNTGFDNLLYADEAYNITKEIVEGLNKRYSPSAGAKK
ncbi:MAG: OmpH family outer membrane protein [Bacteroidaceae bacterium]